MINYFDLERRLKGKSLGASMSQADADKLMPWSYQFANPKGRPLHDDQAIAGIPLGLQPWTKRRRMDSWYRLPLPFKCLEANYEPKWMPWQEGYPEAPEAQFRPAPAGVMTWSNLLQAPVPYEREVLAYDPVPPTDPAQERHGRFAVWLDEGWRECYSASTRVMKIPFFGLKRIHTNGILKVDMTHGDMGCQFPDASCSILTPKENA